jgi:hypothetical protein
MHIFLHNNSNISVGGRYVLAVFLVMMGTIAIVAALYESKKANVARSWEGRKATVIHSEISEHRRFRDGTTEYIPYLNVCGKYLDDGMEFQLKRPSLGEISTPSYLARYLQMCPTGEVITVYVSPDDPEMIVLNNNPNLSQMSYVQMGGALAILYGIVSFVCLVRLPKKLR